MTDDELRSTVASVETLLDVVQCLHYLGTASIETVAKEIGVSTSTVHRHLVTLRQRGYVVVDDGEYSLSLMFLTHGGKVRKRIFASDLVNEKVQQLSEQTDERVQFMTEENGERVYVYTYSGPSGVKTDATIGKRGPLHVSAAGKAILANLPEERTAEILDQTSFDQATERTITDRETLEEELTEVRECGYAFNDQESTDRLRAIGAPITFKHDKVFGAISVSGPAYRLRGDYFREELPALLLGAANEIELNLKYE